MDSRLTSPPAWNLYEGPVTNLVIAYFAKFRVEPISNHYLYSNRNQSQRFGSEVPQELSYIGETTLRWPLRFQIIRC